MLGLNHFQSFLLIVALTAFGFSVDFKRDKAHTDLNRIVSLVALTLFCIGLGAVFCQIAAGFSLSLPLFVGSVPFAVLVRNCSEIPENEFPGFEAFVLGCVSLCGVLAAGL